MKVVQAQTVVVASQDVDVYLVPNAPYSASADTTHALNITMRVDSPKGVVGPVYYDAVTEAHAKVKAETAARVAQGQLVSQDLASMRGIAEEVLLARCRSQLLDCSQLPAEMKGFFDNVVTRDLAQAEREVALAANLRKADLLAIELETDKAEVETNKKASGLVAEIILLQRRQIDVPRIQQGAEFLMREINDKVFPYYRLKYNSVNVSPLAGLRDSLKVEMTLDDAVAKLNTAVSALKDGLASQLNSPPLTQAAAVALAFPRPGSTYSKFWAEADANRSREVWAQIERQHTCAHSNAPVVDCPPPEQASIVLPVKLQDLYAKAMGNASLSCGSRIPVINSMAVYVSVPSTSEPEVANLNRGSNWVATSISGEMTWPSDTGPESYVYDGDPGWQHSMLPVLYGTEYNALTVFSTTPAVTPAATARGLAGSSIFTTFVMPREAEAKLNPQTGLSDNFEPLYEAEAIVLLFKVDYQSGADLTWGTCAN